MKLKELLFPTDFTCFCCDREIPEGSIICDKCFEKLKVIPKEKACVKCGRLIQGDAKVCDKCQIYKPNVERNYGVFMYSDFVSALIYKYKFQKAKYITDKLAAYLFFKVKDIEEDIDLITYVPKFEEDEKDSFNSSLLLAKALSKKTEKPLFDKIKKVKKTKEQKKLNYQERQVNIYNSFQVLEKVQDKVILIVDDVYTTGATIAEVTKELKKKGAKKVISLTLAID